MGPWLTSWTIRVSLLCMAATFGWMLSQRRLRGVATSKIDVPRLLWTVGCGFYLAHVVCAFHFYHHWSHGAALAEVQRQTEEVVGVPFAGGLYFNYLFTLVWAADVAWWWVAGSSAYRSRSRWITALIDGFLAFIAINGAIIFETGPTRWIGVIVVMALAWGYNRVLGTHPSHSRLSRD